MGFNKILFIITVVSCSFLFYLYSNNDSVNKPQTSFSTYKAAVRVNRNISASPADVLFASQIKKTNNGTPKKFSKLKESYFEKLQQHPLKLASELEQIEKEHRHLLKTMRDEGVQIDRLVGLKPKLAIVLSYYLNLGIRELSTHEINQIELTNKEWHLIKSFSESKDFKLMLKRDSLTSEYVQLDNLARTYN